MKRLLIPFALFLVALLVVLIARGQDDGVYLVDTNGSFFRATNVAKRINVVDSRTFRGGSQLLTAPELSKVVTFNNPMPDATYIVIATPSLPTTVSVANKTVNGFTLNLTAGIAGRVDWLAINPQ